MMPFVALAFLILFAAGLFLGVWALSRGTGRASSARETLAERFAKGEISADEYRERLEVLGGKPGRRPPTLGPIALALLAAGIVGSLVVGAVWVGRAFTHGAGRGHMGGMMEGMGGGGMGGMMSGGEPGRSGPPPEAGAREVRVLGREFAFDPNEVSVTRGETVNVVFDNRGHMFHTLTIGGLSFELRANGAQTMSGSFRADALGTYTFICTVPGTQTPGCAERSSWRPARSVRV